ncbi:hypothetical protein PspLS_09254 [Pyricularia sp. CBS 133598]|nr:hypothetical protein PspLS_09254 [Pyricularia sp. CBS 133598]
MKDGKILMVLPTTVAAIHDPLPAAPGLHLATRQQATMTTTSSINEAQVAREPTELASPRSEVYRSATGECGSWIAADTAGPEPESLVSIFESWDSTVRSIAGSYLSSNHDVRKTCLAAYSSSIAAAAATTTAASRTSAATSTATTTTSAGTPANTGATGRSGVSTSLAFGAMAVFGYFGLA